MVGLPGSSKTTLAKQLEQRHSAVRFTPDEWMMPLFGAGESGDKRWRLESELFWTLAARLLSLGMNVILDYGLWSREERDLFRARAEALGARVELHALELPLDQLWARIERRNLALTAQDAPISHEELTGWWHSYQRPDKDELALYANAGYERHDE